MQTLPTTTELPDSYFAGIGKVMVKYAFIERQLATIGYMLLGVGVKHGRVAVRSPRADEQVSMIEQLMHLERITAEGFDLAALKRVLASFQRYRDLIAHGVWLKDGDTYKIQDLSGTWRPDPNGPKVARRITPEGLIVTPDALHEFAAMLGDVSRDIDLFHRHLGEKVLVLRRQRHETSPPERLPEEHEPDNPTSDTR